MKNDEGVTGGWCLSQDGGRNANPCTLRTTGIQRLLCASCWKSIFVFLAISYLWIYYKEFLFFFFKTKILLTCIITRTQRRQYSKHVCSFCKVLVQRQKSENRWIFWSLLMTWCFNVTPSATKDLSLMGQRATAQHRHSESLRLLLNTFCHRNKDLNIRGIGNSSSSDQCTWQNFSQH